MHIRFPGKTAIVTGAERGSGPAIAPKSISVYRHMKPPTCRHPRDNAAAHAKYLASCSD